MFLSLPVCVKSSELGDGLLVSCTINTDFILNLLTTKTDSCPLHLCHARLVMSVVLSTVVATSKS